ncbi:MAG: ABC transporter ATP-binding protein, partial [Tissierellia bacterium]|nr:ABC transporter ATP-binding protein [Tissierellia bacterium]
TLTNILSNLAILATALVAMYRMNWILATLGVIIVPLFAIPTKKVGRTRWELTLESQRVADELNQMLNETLSVSGQLLVKLFTNEELEYERYEGFNEEMFHLNIKESMAGRWFRMVISTLTNIGPMLIYLAGGALIIIYGNESLSVGDITVMVALLGRMYRPVNQLLNIQVDLIRSMALFTRIFDYFDMEVEIENSPKAIIPSTMRGDIEFRDVVFYYEKEVPILKNLSFKLEGGRSIAIVGPSGAGKSTLINLIPRLYDVVDGQLLIDGHDVRELDLHFLRSNVGIVTQDSYLFNGTIRENLLYAKADASEEELISACKEANIHDFIISLPDGYDSLVGNRGLKLSGGEKQRLSIARVILKDPPILIFDEATSSLDSISESLIQEAIDPLIASRTSLVIAHRLSTIMAADEIFVLEDGRVVERGSHSKLVEGKGLYRELYETQFKKALEQEGLYS